MLSKLSIECHWNFIFQYYQCNIQAIQYDWKSQGSSVYVVLDLIYGTQLCSLMVKDDYTPHWAIKYMQGALKWTPKDPGKYTTLRT